MRSFEDNEIQEAKLAGREALSCLQRAKAALNQASTWGLCDMVGGGKLVTFLKYSRMNEAKEAMAAAKRALGRFQSELLDVRQYANMDFTMWDALAFFDLFCDNLVSDVMVQNRIYKAKGEVDRMIEVVSNILYELDS